MNILISLLFPKNCSKPISLKRENDKDFQNYNFTQNYVYFKLTSVYF